MNKICSGRHPERGQKQHTAIGPAILSMLNCRKYLAGGGFQEIHDIQYYSPATCVSGKIIFPDGSEIDEDAFQKINSSKEKDSLLEMMIEKPVQFRRYSILDDIFECRRYQLDRVIRTTFGGRDYTFQLSVIDTTKGGIVFPALLFMLSPRRFSFRYDIQLRKNVISDKDAEEFQKYALELNNHSKQAALSAQNADADNTGDGASNPKYEFTDPWAVDIHKIGGKN